MKVRILPVVSGLFALVLYSCAQDVGTIDRTQHDKIEKKVFAGVWYYNQTVIDVPYSTGFTFVGETNFGAMNKIVWDIQEKYLIAYPVAEYVVGSEKGWKKQKIRIYWDEDRMDEFIELYVGHPVAAFEIVSHFDVFRKYNPQTGEQTNVLEENTVDNKWWKRKYIRVNWARNSIADFTFMARVAKQTPVDYYVQTFETENPDAPVITEDYIDVVTKSFVEPESFGSCDLYRVSTGSCVGAVIKFRHSFRKVNPNNDYEPLRYHNEEHMNNYGFFLTERYVYDKDYGNIYSGKVSLINRWNIWKQSQDETPVMKNGETAPKKCFKDLDDTGCDRLNGEFCKATDWFVEGECVLRVSKPFTHREIRPIIYHLSSAFPEYLYEESYEAVNEWDAAFKDTVAWLRFWEEKGYMYGQYQTRSCKTNEDCASHAALDTMVELKYKENVTCSDINPCPSLAHKCENGLCLTKKDNKIVQRDAAKSVIFLGKSSNPQLIEITDNDYPNKFPKEAAVRFLNLNPRVQKATLVMDNGTTLAENVEYNLNNHAPAYKLVAPVTSTFHVKVDGNIIASRAGVTLAANSVSLFILTKGNKLIRASASPPEIGGIRFIHASEEDKALEVAINGGRRDAELLFGENTGYMGVVPKVQKDPVWKDPFYARLTVIYKGDRTDVTCYRFEQHGRCVGWKPELTGEDYERWQEIYDSLPNIFVLCQNIYDGDKEGGYDAKYQIKDEQGKVIYDPCKDFVPGFDKLKKIGDSRYSMIYWIPEAQSASPLGYGPSAVDPDSGEIYWATANIYGAPLLTYGQMAKDLIDLINGNLNPADVSVGKHVRDFLVDKYGSKSSALSPSDEIKEPVEMFDKENHYHVSLLKDRELTGSDLAEMLKIASDKSYLAKLIKTKAPIINPKNGKKRLELVRGTYFEDLMITDEIKLALSGGKLTPGDTYTDEEKVKLSPLNWATWDTVRAEKDRLRFLGSKNYCFADFDDEAIIGIAKELGCTPEEKKKGKACLEGEELFKEITRRFYGGLVEHEIGHTVGIRHNFRGSADLFNYHDEYFIIRELETLPCSYNFECDLGEACINGFCTAKVETSRSCLKDPDCGSTDDYLCREWRCHKITKCSVNGDCGEGGECRKGICYSEGGAKIATLDSIVEEKHVTKMLPRAAMTESEKLNKRTEYEYSTLMDYGQRFNSNIRGLGKWDRATIRFGYGQMVEVYRDITNLKKLMKLYAELYEEPLELQSDVFDSSYWNYGVFFSQFFFLNNYIGIKENLLRDVVPYELVKLEQNMVYTYDRGLMEYSYVLVPYSFCGDEYAGNVGCYRWDTGVDILEIVHHNSIMLQQYYLMDAFKRERFGFALGGNPFSYFTRILYRWLTPMQDAGMFYALFSHLLKDYGWIDQWRYARQYGWALREASEDGFNHLRKILASPAPGSYKENSEDNTFYNISSEQGVEGSELNLPIGVGKYPYTTFYDEAGMYYYEHPQWIGSFWEKLAAIMTLTDSTVYFTTDFVGEQLAIGVGTSVGFNTIYQKELSKLLGGLIAGDYSQFADYVYKKEDEKGKEVKLVIRDYFPKDTYNGEPLLRPSLDSFSLKLYAALYGLAYLPASIDPTFIDSLAVCLKGNGNCYDLGSSSEVDVVEFDDPFGGKTYVAWSTKYEGDRFNAAYELVKKANALKAKYLAVTGEQKELLKKQLKETIEVLDMLRGLFELMGNMKI